MSGFTVIIADIKASRKMRDHERYEWQLFLKSAIVQVNENYAQVVEAPFMITKGDEFQGVLNNFFDLNKIMLEFEHLVFPLNLRFGIGHGTIQKMGSNIPIEMDGQAFHRANDALNRAKKKKQAVYLETGNQKFDLTVNTLYHLLYAIKGRWSPANYNRYWKYKELGTYERVADQEGVSPQAIWDSLRNANAMEVINAEQAIDAILREHDLTELAHLQI